jgi:hypothetical protein
LLFNIKEKWRKYYKPSNHLIIDEGLIPYRGESKKRYYLCQNKFRYGLKMYVLADTNSYILNVKPILKDIKSIKHKQDTRGFLNDD